MNKRINDENIEASNEIVNKLITFKDFVNALNKSQEIKNKSQEIKNKSQEVSKHE